MNANTTLASRQSSITGMLRGKALAVLSLAVMVAAGGGYGLDTAHPSSSASHVATGDPGWDGPPTIIR